MKDRESGYYWVKRWHGIVSEIAYYSKTNNDWGMIGFSEEFSNDDFEEILEERLPTTTKI